MSRRLFVLLAVVAAIVPAGAEAATPYAPVDHPGPSLSVRQAALDRSLSCGGGPLEHAAVEPVLLIPGTATTPKTDFGWNYEPALTAAGIPWCAVELPGSALGDIQTAGEYVVNGIRTMRARAGRRIALVGHSQGGMVGRWALRWWPDTRAMVEDVIGNAPSNHGTIVAQALKLPCPLIGCAPSIIQQTNGSRFLAALNSGQETFAGIDYTVNYSRYDEIVVPAAGARLSGPGRIANTMIQDVCPGDLAEHLAIGTYDNTAWALTLDALTHDGPADPARLDRTDVCGHVTMPGVNPYSFAADFGATGLALGAAVAGNFSVREEPALACYVTAACPAVGTAGGTSATRRCTGARRFTVTLDGGTGASRLRRVTRATLDGRALKVVRSGGRPRATLDLRRRTRGTAVLRVRGVDARGRTVTRVRRFPICG